MTKTPPAGRGIATPAEAALSRAMTAAVAACSPDGPPPASPAWTATVPGRARSLNAERSGHWSAHRAATDADREAWGWAWRAARPRLPFPFEAPVVVAARPHQGPGGVLQDPGNCYPSVKAAVDALVDVRAMPDDSGEYVAAVILLPPVRSAAGDALSVSLAPLEPPGA